MRLNIFSLITIAGAVGSITKGNWQNVVYFMVLYVLTAKLGEVIAK